MAIQDDQNVSEGADKFAPFARAERSFAGAVIFRDQQSVS
jgi:hypothetical protein